MLKNFCKDDKKQLLSSSSRDPNAVVCAMFTKCIPWAQTGTACIYLIFYI